MASSFSPSTRLPVLSPPSFSKSHFTHKPFFSLLPKNPAFTLYTVRASADNGAGTLSPVATEKEPVSEQTVVVPGEESSMAKGSAAVAGEVEAVKKFDDPKWVGGTWELKQFSKNGGTDWDAVIDAEAKRRKWLENNPESSSNEDPVIFETSIIPWWAWIKRYHLPEAELLNGRAAMIGFFMAYFVDSLTGVGLVDQMGNFFCKTLLFIAVSGVLLIRKNEDLVTLKKLFEETTYYDKQWQAAWKDESNSSSKTE